MIGTDKTTILSNYGLRKKRKKNKKGEKREGEGEGHSEPDLVQKPPLEKDFPSAGIIKQNQIRGRNGMLGGDLLILSYLLLLF